MKKRILLCVLLCCGLLLTMLAACDNTPEPLNVVNFADGKTDFLLVNTGAPDTDPDASMELKDLDGGKAVAITAPNGGEMRLGVNLDGLLGERVTEVKTIVFNIYAEYPSGTFRAVNGRIAALSGSLAPFADNSWAIYTENRNPNQGVLSLGNQSFTEEGPNIVEFSCLTNTPAEKGEIPAVIYIKSISFYGEDDAEVPIADTGALWSAPEGYGWISVERTLQLPLTANVIDDGSYGFFEYYTWGYDAGEGVFKGPDKRYEVGVDDYLPWETLAVSYGIMFEMPEPELDFVTIFFGAYSGWGWNAGQKDITPYTYEDGKLTILWVDTANFNPLLITEDDWSIKMRFGFWDEAYRLPDMVSAAYLLYYESVPPEGQ